jgi:hypothetical protein
MIGTKNLPEQLRNQACVMLRKSRRHIGDLKSLRAVSFATLGLYYLLENYNCNNKDEKKALLEQEEFMSLVKKLANLLVKRYQQQAARKTKHKWQWFEDVMTYSNYKLPEALLRAYKSEILTSEGRRGIDKFCRVSFEQVFSAIGQTAGNIVMDAAPTDQQRRYCLGRRH